MFKDKGQFLMLVQVRQGRPRYWLEISYLELFVNAKEVDEEDGEDCQGYEADDHDRDDHSFDLVKRRRCFGVRAVEKSRSRGGKDVRNKKKKKKGESEITKK